MNMFNDIDEAIQSAIQNVAVGPDRGRDITLEHAQQVMHGILDGIVDPIQAAVFLIALRMKRESEDEMRGLTLAAQARVNVQSVQTDSLVCLVDPFDGYLRTISVSAFIPAVLAACGVACVVHGVESVGPKYGATVRQVLGVHPNSQFDFNRTAVNIEASGWTYVDQRDYLPELYQLIPLRNSIIKRTAITTFERVLAPVVSSGTNHLCLGYVHKAYPQIYAAIAQQAGFDYIHMHKGAEGGLMIAPNKPFLRYSADLRKSPISLVQSHHAVQESSTSLPRLDAGLAPEQRAQACYEQGMFALQGQAGVSRDVLLAACANILSSVEPDLDYLQALEKARVQIDNGSALECFISALSW